MKLGQEAASQARKELPMLNDDGVDDWVEDIGRRLADAIPAEFQHREFKYSFDVINQKEINAFALPGGPMFLNRGMIEAAKSEGEVAGVMAHELSHVALRHGTAGAGKSTLPGILGVGGQILGGILGGALGNVIGLGSQVGATAWVTKYGREFETQADILGAQMMARAGYDPREMANMFKTIEAQGGGGPEWLSSHPNPGNRYNAINREAQSLRVTNPVRDTGEFRQVQARLRGMSPAYTAEQIAKAQKQGGSVPTGTAGRSVRVEPPSGQYRGYRAGNVMELSVPSNWRQANDGGSLLFAPEGGLYETQNGGVAYTHGVQLGMGRMQTNNLQRETDALLQSFARNNPQLRRSGGYRQENIDGHRALTAQLTNVSDITGQREYVSVTTIALRDGSMAYLIGVSPQTEAQAYENAFRNVRRSVQLND